MTRIDKELLDELIEGTEPDRCANCEHAGMVEAAAAMDGLRGYPSSRTLCDYHAGVFWLADALLARLDEPDDIELYEILPGKRGWFCPRCQVLYGPTKGLLDLS